MFKYFLDKNSQKLSLWSSQLGLKIDFLEAFSMLSQRNSVLWWIAIRQGVELRQMLPCFLRHIKIQIWSCPTVIIKMTFRDTATIWREIIHSIGQAHHMFSRFPNLRFFPWNFLCFVFLQGRSFYWDKKCRYNCL